MPAAPLATLALAPPRAPSVVLVHGLRTSSAIWDAQVGHLAATGTPAVAVDLPGHGAHLGDPFTASGAFAAIDAAIDALPGGAPVLLVGLSLGGYTALAYAERRPERVVGVVAAACTADPRGKPVRAYRDLARGGRATWSRLRATARSLRPVWPPPGAELDLDAGGLVVARPSWDVVTAALTVLARHSSVRTLRALTVPVWLVNGSRDPMRLEERRHVRAAADGRLVVVPAAGHDVSTDAPAAFNTVLDEALARVGGRLVA